MRSILLAGLAVLAATSARADTITEIGTPLGTANTEYFASLIYQFAPLAVPGTVTGIIVTYVGSVVPGDYITGLSTVSDITLTPYAQIANVSSPVVGIGYSNFIVPPQTTAVAGAPQTFPANRFGNGPLMGFVGSPITASTAAALFPDNIAALASGPILLAVEGYATISGRTYIPGAIGSLNAQADASSVSAGRLTLAVTYDPATRVPEPMSVALLGAGLLGLLGLRRRA